MRKHQIVERKFGKLLAIHRSSHDAKHNNVYYMCQCDCGRFKEIRRANLLHGIAKTCGCSQYPSEEQRLLSIKNRLLSNIKIDSSTQCWNWTGYKSKLGYGSFPIHNIHGYRKRMLNAHRASAVIFLGLDLRHNKKFVLHKCDNPLCINPAHLYIGSHADNMRDRNSRNRQIKGLKHSNSKLTPTKVRRMRQMYATGKYSYKELGKKFGVTKWPAMAAIKGILWAHVK